jgi:ABC-type transport system substrate-binding protein
MTSLRRLAGLLAIAAVLAACSSSGAASAPPTDPPASSAAPSDPRATTPAPSDSGGGIIPGPDQPISDVPGKPHIDPGPGGATLVTPKPGQLDIHPVSLDSIAASVDGRHVVLTAFWWSGVEPCSTLDTIVVAQGVGTFTITLREGHGPGEVACIDLAQLKATHIDLGDLEPGTYTVADGGGGTARATFEVS